MDVIEIERGNETLHEAQSFMELLPNYYAWTYGKFAGVLHGEVIELGCGAGIGIKTYLDRVTRVHAVDYNPELLHRINESFHSDKVATRQADLRGDWHELAGLQGNAVIMMDVLEHFSDDAAFLSKAVGLLKPGGYLIAKVPAQSSLFSEMDIASGHFRRYDPDDLKRLAEAANLRTVYLSKINPVGGLMYRFRNKRKSNFSKTFSPTQLQLINALIPVIARFDALSMLPGLSLVGIFQRSL